MVEIKQIKFYDAEHAQFRIDPGSDYVQLHCLNEQNGPLVVTIPLKQLGLLYADIGQRLKKEPDLFSRGSKKGRRTPPKD
jgi:hypothetical protein